MATRFRASLRPPQTRYWRRRANRRVRKARRTRSLLRWAAIVAINLAMVGILAVAGLRAVRHLTTSPSFALREIWLAGVERSSGVTLRHSLAPLIGNNLFDVDLQRVAALAVTDPWVRGASVRRMLPHTLRVQVLEREPAAVAVIGGLAHLVDTEGFVIGPCGAGAADDLPVLQGLAGLEGKRLAVALSDGVRAIARLRTASPAWADGVSELDLARTDRIVVRMARPGPRLLLDPLRVERNVNPYLALRGEIDRRVGPADYVDLRWGGRISVMPAARFLPRNED